MGAAGTVAVAFLIAITLVPALIGFAPIRVLRRRDRAGFRSKPVPQRGLSAAAGGPPHSDISQETVQARN